MEYGNIINHVYGTSAVKEPEPHVGMGCTELMWSDRAPWEVVEIKRNRKGVIAEISVRAMKAEPDTTKNLGIGHQEWILSSNPNGIVGTLKFRRGKRHHGWYMKGEWGWGNKFLLGHAEKYYDWSF